MLKKVNLVPFLETVVEDRPLHLRWLSTLALMEHIGARKIHKSIPRLPRHLQMNESVLQHAAEEARHAYFFKKQIGRLMGTDSERQSPPQEPAPLCKWPGIKYFQKLDGWCRRRAGELFPEPSRTDLRTLYCYLAVTYIIEERAVDVYTAYEQILRERDIPIHLSGLLKEEEGHMQEILNMAAELPVDFEQELEALATDEEVLFQSFAESLSHSALSAAVL